MNCNTGGTIVRIQLDMSMNMVSRGHFEERFKDFKFIPRMMLDISSKCICSVSDEFFECGKVFFVPFCEQMFVRSFFSGSVIVNGGDGEALVTTFEVVLW